MISIFDIEALVIEKLRQTQHKGRLSKYEALVQSAISLNAQGCDGFIMMEVESLIDTALNELDEGDLTAIYYETEMGMEASAQDLEPTSKEWMLHDVTGEVQEHIAEAICSEANERIKRTTRKGKKA